MLEGINKGTACLDRRNNKITALHMRHHVFVHWETSMQKTEQRTSITISSLAYTHAPGVLAEQEHGAHQHGRHQHHHNAIGGGAGSGCGVGVGGEQHGLACVWREKSE